MKWATRNMGPGFRKFLEDLEKKSGIVPSADNVRHLYAWYLDQKNALGVDDSGDRSPIDPIDIAQNNLEDIVRLLSPFSSNFYVEPDRYDFILEHVLPPQYMTKGPYRKLNFLSAGCGTGEEAYTLAITAHMFGEDMDSPFSYGVTGIDVCSNCLETARAGIYPEEKWLTVPLKFRKKYFMRSKDRGRKVFRISQEIRDNTEFKKLNLIGDYNLEDRFDVIMCGNVFDYLTKERARKVVNNLAGYLCHGGVLVFGEKEVTPFGKKSMLKLAPGIYKPKQAE